jgi:phosphatidylglycerophosphate synthase
MKWFRENLANTISLLRVIFLPMVVYSGLNGYSGWFVFFVLVSFFSDAVDGTIARALKTESEFGRNVDSYADYIFYPVLLILFAYIFRVDIVNNYVYVITPIILFLTPKLIGLYYLRKFPFIHLRSIQIIAYPIVIWILVSVYYGFNVTFLKIIDILVFISFIEETLIYLINKEKTNESIHSIFDTLKK